MFKTSTYLILPEKCRFSLCTRFTGNNQLQEVSWLFTAGTVSTSFNSSVQCSENTPKVWRSMQLIYYPNKCNTADIQETPYISWQWITSQYDFIFYLTKLFFHFTYVEIFFFFLTDTFIFGSLIVSKIAALKGNYFIPKCCC